MLHQLIHEMWAIAIDDPDICQFVISGCAKNISTD